MTTQLTPQQLATLKTAILAETDPAFVTARTQGQTPLMTAWYNSPTSPAVKAWASSVDPQVTDEATPWTLFDNISVAPKREGWLHGFLRYPRDYSKGPVRKWVTDVWGNATAGSAAAAILSDAGQRTITRGEAVLGGTVQTSTNTVIAIKLAWEGQITDEDISASGYAD
jgi:hypothetical protein